MPETAGVAEAREPESALGRLVGVFVSPAKTFESIARRPGWVLPMVLWTVLSLALTAVVMPRTDWEKAVRDRVAGSGQTLSDEEIEKQAQGAQNLGWLYYAIGLAGPWFIAGIVAGALWLGMKAFGWELAFRQSFGVTAHAFLPGILASVLLIPLLLREQTVDPNALGDMLRSNLGFLADAKEAPALHSILQSIDLFSIWSIVLLTVGLAAAAKATRGKVAVLVVTLWALYVIGKAGVSALFG